MAVQRLWGRNTEQDAKHEEKLSKPSKDQLLSSRKRAKELVEVATSVPIRKGQAEAVQSLDRGWVMLFTA